MNIQRMKVILRRTAIGAGVSLVAGWPFAAAIATAPTVPISQVPMTVEIPAHPQILLAVGNSESMDGTLTGAILTGAGDVGTAYSALYNSSSPVNFTIPTGFTPPLNAGSSGVAPYTVTTGSIQYDNSPSRLNVAKAGITSILDNYIADADFALMDYQTSALNSWMTWVYQMSPAGGFQFTNTATPPLGDEVVPNPCYGVNITLPYANNVSKDCGALNTFYLGQNITAQQYMVVSASSDDASVNDVLYAPAAYIDPVCVVYSGPHPATPYPPNYSLGNYETGSVLESYSSEVNTCATETGPTNAGYVPYTAQVMYEQRGFGYYTSSETPNAGQMLVTMTSAGQTPTPTSVATAIAKFTPYLAPETNSTGTTEMKAAATQSPIAGLLAGAYNYFKTNPTSSNGCAAQRYVVLMTDGLPTLDLSNHAWPPLGSAAAATTGYNVSATFNTSAPYNLISTNDQALTDVMTEIAALQSLSPAVNVYIIGVGAGVNPAVNPTAASTLTAMAVAGGTNAYFPANSPGAVTADLQVIITKILAATQSVASAAVNSTGLNTNSVVYQSQFTTSDLYQDWTGNLFAFPINATTGAVNTTPSVPPALWSAQTQLDAQRWDTGRLIATWDPAVSQGTPFQWNSGTPTSGIATTTTLGQDLENFTPDTNGQDVLQFLRGANAQEVRFGGQFRNRTHKLGDIVSSDPLYIGAPSSNNQSASYVAFAQLYASRPPMIYVGADDGMLHAFNAATGNEMFAYIPTGVFANLTLLANPYYNAVHQFYVNGSPQASDVQFSDNSWHTVLVGTEAQGGNSVYALDVTNPGAITTESQLASKVLWDFTEADMGLGFSTPALTNTADGWQVFFGNGYNSRYGKPFLYAVNPQNGSQTTKIDLCAAVPTACNLSVANGLSTVIAVNSSGQLTQNSTLVYAGDLQGNVWRVNISNTNPALWTVTVMFQARDASGNIQHITTSPVATLNPRYPAVLGTMVYFVTGQLLGTPDLATTQVQTIYGIFDPAAGYSTPLLRTSAALEAEPLSYAYSNSNAIIVTGTALTIPTQEGWYIDFNLPACSSCTPSQLAHTGERGVTDPRIESGGAVVLTTYQPNSNVCTVGGNSFLYVLNYAGGSFSSPQFDLTGSGSPNSSAVTNSSGATQYASGMGLGAVFAAAPTIRTANLTNAGAVKLITRSDGTIQTVVEKGNSKSRTAWWEVHQ
jgi:type IV pilus assembly protein PilY1